VVDERGKMVEGWRYRHNEPGIRRCALGCRVCRWRWWRSFERPDGLLIDGYSTPGWR
jgi:hypothetical protein